jgi:hypothetical protein
MRSGKMPLAWVGSENDTVCSLGGSPNVIQTPEISLLPGYPMAALTERAQPNISMTYPVVI